ncbi:MAG: Murein tripeptide amidase MpaA [Verrucomicrobia bacterium]|nr:MAG: Murein tripeptide amidase MpaA [Verrucomicrobiota bacterium]
MVLLSIFLAGTCNCAAKSALRVATGFEGGSAADIKIDQETRTIEFAPGGDPVRGWPCWWYFRVEGIEPGETLHLKLRGSTATVSQPGGALMKPLSSSWAMPAHASTSADGTVWTQTANGVREGDWMLYSIRSEGVSFYAAWGPPCTPQDAVRWTTEFAQRKPSVQALELCRSREGRSVPMLRVVEGDKSQTERFGVWVQARQHAWESGSSWVARGFMEWVLGDSEKAETLRRSAEIMWVPIMDVDNTATGNGGKDALPYDHNRDWSDLPHWNETKAAQARVKDLIQAGRMDVFLDLHNPGPDDPTFFFLLDPAVLSPEMAERQRHFADLGYRLISQVKPLIPMSVHPKMIGANYSQRWREMSAHWVALHGNPRTVAVCLETIWNSAASTTDGYRKVGQCLAEALANFLAEQPQHQKP